MAEAQQSEASGRRYWDRHAKNYDRSALVLGKAMPAMLKRIQQVVRGKNRVLEVAAGTGLITAVLASEAREVVATDYAQAMVEQLEARMQGSTRVKCAQADLYALPFEAHSFDVVVAANVLHLVPDLDAALQALGQMLRPGGTLLLPTPCHDQTMLSWVLSRVLAVTGFPGQRRFTLRSLSSAVEAAGFSVQRSELLSGPIPIGYLEALALQPAGALSNQA